MEIQVTSKKVFIANENRWMVISLPKLRFLENSQEPEQKEPEKILAWRPPPKVVMKMVGNPYTPKESRPPRSPGQLTKREKEILGYHLQGMKSSQIANVAGITSSRVRKIIRTAKKILENGAEAPESGTVKWKK